VREVSVATTGRSELTWTSAGRLAEMIANKEVSSREVVAAHVERNLDLHPKLNAVVLPRYAEAVAEAEAADRRQAAGEPLGRLHGVPITVKECYDLTGLPNTGGGLRWLSEKSKTDAPMAGRLKAAGAVVLGKTNMPNLMLFNEGDNPLYGRTNNPWDLTRSPGGGSSGEGSIIAAGGSPMGLATDYGGSVRIPPDFCGIHGFRPTYGRFTMRGTFDTRLFPGLETPIDQPGVMARHMSDIELGFEILRTGGSGEPDHAMLPRDWKPTAGVSLRGLRIAYYEQDATFPASPAKRRAVREAVHALADQGAEVDEFLPPDLEHGRNIFLALLSAGGRRWIDRLSHGEHLDRRAGHPAAAMRMSHAMVGPLSRAVRALGQPMLASYMADGGRRSTADYWDLILERDAYRDRFYAALDEGRYQVIVCPTFPIPAFKHGTNYFLTTLMTSCQVYNLLGLPCGHVTTTRIKLGEEGDRQPTGEVANRYARIVEAGSAGLPTGVQVVGRPWREDAVLAVMSFLEGEFRSRPDYPDRPPI
jgi:fatty acid amide hydrolase